MLSIHDDGLQVCDGLTRREWLRIGGPQAITTGRVIHEIL